MNYVDVHVHLDFCDDFYKVIQQYEERKIYTISVTNLPELYEVNKSKYNYKESKYVKLALGYHPEMIDFYEFNEVLFSKYIDDTDYIGEIGINKTSKTEDLLKQIDIFQKICCMLDGKAKVVSIHSRGAEKYVLDTLKTYEIKFPIIHWYSGSINILNELVKMGCYFSVNSSMLKSKKGNLILESIPMDKILFETDSPFTKYDKKTCYPLLFDLIYKEFNEFYGINNFDEIVFKNFKKLIVDKYNYKNISILRSI